MVQKALDAPWVLRYLVRGIEAHEALEALEIHEALEYILGYTPKKVHFMLMVHLLSIQEGAKTVHFIFLHLYICIYIFPTNFLNSF